MISSCPCCGGHNLPLLITREEIAAEMRLQQAFAHQSVPGATDDEQTDRATFTHSEAAAVHVCRTCGLLVRGDVDTDFTAVYTDEAYDESVLNSLLERDKDFFEHEKASFKDLLPHGARVLELGSYTGGFLYTAERWGWDAVGVDVGLDVTAFANAHGFPTHRGTLESCAFGDASFDGVFVWNCFDQLTHPGDTLMEIRRVLRPGGPLVLRTPNALFYRLCRPLLSYVFATERDAARIAASPIVRVLGYNNLLGFPYQYGYATPNLKRIVMRHGFTDVRFEAGRLAALPPDAPQARVAEEERLACVLSGVSDALRSYDADQIAAPWIEAICN